jgi:hypothetical protein
MADIDRMEIFRRRERENTGATPEMMKAMEAVDAAVLELAKARPGEEPPVLVAWGDARGGGAEERGEVYGQKGLLKCGDHDLEVEVAITDHLVGKERLAFCLVQGLFGEPISLSGLGGERMHEVLNQCCVMGLGLMTNFDGELQAVGVSVHVPVTNLNGKALGTALYRLLVGKLVIPRTLEEADEEEPEEEG